MDNNFFVKFESFKNNFDDALKLIENKIAQQIISKSKLDKLNHDLDEINQHINDTETSLEELKSILK